ncbi:hypothetical protein BSF41_35330 [Flavobacterium sp. ACN2]|nr:hypothetical protein BSF41_35330 [Flavobacterium sp. ACN2]
MIDTALILLHILVANPSVNGGVYCFKKQKDAKGASFSG